MLSSAPQYGISVLCRAKLPNIESPGISRRAGCCAACKAPAVLVRGEGWLFQGVGLRDGSAPCTAQGPAPCTASWQAHCLRQPRMGPPLPLSRCTSTGARFIHARRALQLEQLPLNPSYCTTHPFSQVWWKSAAWPVSLAPQRVPYTLASTTPPPHRRSLARVASTRNSPLCVIPPGIPRFDSPSTRVATALRCAGSGGGFGAGLGLA